MELRSFQIDIPGKGTVNVDFALHFNDEDVVSVQDIKLHADFDSGLPHRAELVMHNNLWQLHAEMPVMKNDEVIIMDEYLKDDISKEIVKRLLASIDSAK